MRRVLDRFEARASLQFARFRAFRGEPASPEQIERKRTVCTGWMTHRPPKIAPLASPYRQTETPRLAADQFAGPNCDARELIGGTDSSGGEAVQPIRFRLQATVPRMIQIEVRCRRYRQLLLIQRANTHLYLSCPRSQPTIGCIEMGTAAPKDP